MLSNYHLKIIYRPGILHVLPDALSRMYGSAYTHTDKVWGTLSNIDLVNAYNSIAVSPSDKLCEQSINDIVPMKTVNKRHKTMKVLTISSKYDNDMNNDYYAYDDTCGYNRRMFSIDDEAELDYTDQYGPTCHMAMMPHSIFEVTMNEGILSTADNNDSNTIVIIIIIVIKIFN